MPYVQREASGVISAVFQAPGDDHREFVADDDPALQSFLQSILPQKSGNHPAVALSESDLSLIRVIEDVVDTLIAKNIIRLTDLPVPAQKKLLERKSMRERMFGDLDISISEDKIF